MNAREKLPVVTLLLRLTKARGSQVRKADVPYDREKQEETEQPGAETQKWRDAPGLVSPSPLLGLVRGRGDGQGDLLPLETLPWG